MSDPFAQSPLIRPRADRDAKVPRKMRRRAGVLGLAVAICFASVTGQLVRLGLQSAPEIAINRYGPIERSIARPDIVDRFGDLLATDIATPSLFANPRKVYDVDEVLRELETVLPGIATPDLRRALENKSSQFEWIKRGLTPGAAQMIHDLGLPGLDFRRELRRVYPAGTLASHLLGHVDIDNAGRAGIEAYIDREIGVEPVDGPRRSSKPPVVLTINLAVQYALRDELQSAISTYKASAAAGIVLDIVSGEVLGASSLPDYDPNQAGQSLDPARIDRLSGGSFELGSVFKLMTLGMALDNGIAGLDSIYDASEPLQFGDLVISDYHGLNRPMTAREVFRHSSNIGAARMALQAGGPTERAFLGRLGLLEPLKTEEGSVAKPQLPPNWSDIYAATVAYGHGIAVAPIQFAAAAATLLNGGRLVRPTFIRKGPVATAPSGSLVVSPVTSERLLDLMRDNVLNGTGRRADVAGYKIGGKTGTADLAAEGGYREGAVLSSFLAVFPTDAPRYLTFIVLFEPLTSPDKSDGRTAGLTAAPATGALISRIAPALGMLPDDIDGGS